MRRRGLKQALGVISGVVLLGLGPAAMAPAVAQGLVPADFFNAPVDPSAPTAVEADELVFDAASNTITARGDVACSVAASPPGRW